NGIFDSKVLSRNHAEIWYEDDKVLIKDVKSSNGTFVNGGRLSEEGQVSAPHELRTADVIEFGIDIMNDDGATSMPFSFCHQFTTFFLLFFSQSCSIRYPVL
ncbi:SMAD/FHA domain-containing protein, partial [Chytridium lagenaria]